MTRARHRCAACDRSVTAARSRPCVRGCGARLCRAPHQPPCTDLHGGQCPNLQLPPGDPVTDEPTPRDILNVSAVIDDLAASAAIEDALRIEPLTRQEQINEVLVRQVHENGDPNQIRQADMLMDAYKLGLFRGDV